MVGADRAEPPGPGKPVTVIDSGVDLTHPEFAARPGTEPLNAQVLSPGDGYPHGTAVSSVVGAPANALGVVGVYPQAVLRTWDADARQGALTTSGVVGGLDAAIRKGPSVINLSLGVASSQVLEDLVNAAFGSGSLVVAAVGNDRAAGAAARACRPSFRTSSRSAVPTRPGRSPRSRAQSPMLDLAAPATDIPVAVPVRLRRRPATRSSTGRASPRRSWPGRLRGSGRSRPTLDNTQLFELMRTSSRDIAPTGRDQRHRLRPARHPGCADESRARRRSTGAERRRRPCPCAAGSSARRRRIDAAAAGRAALTAPGSTRPRISRTSTGSGSRPAARSSRRSARTGTSRWPPGGRRRGRCSSAARR